MKLLFGQIQPIPNNAKLTYIVKILIKELILRPPKIPKFMD